MRGGGGINPPPNAKAGGGRSNPPPQCATHGTNDFSRAIPDRATHSVLLEVLFNITDNTYQVQLK